jgi:diguanylate cyclase (GGDEF)-like protein
MNRLGGKAGAKSPAAGPASETPAAETPAAGPPAPGRGADAGRFSLFSNEEQVLRKADQMLRGLEELAAGVTELADAYRKGYREQQRLVRLSDRMQLDLQRAKARLSEQAIDLQALNRTLAAEVDHRGRLEAELRSLLDVDTLTGARSRRNFFELGTREVARSQRSESPLALMMIDLDRFKLLNDTYGHETGDVALRGFVEVTQPLIRALDVLGRLGGEEFAVLLSDTGVEHATGVAERICRAVARAPVITPQGQALSITVSIGVAELLPGETLQEVLHRADRALYEAKRAGRNRVALAPAERLPAAPLPGAEEAP